MFGVSLSPFLLNATIRRHLEHYQQSQPALVKKLSKLFYVDDLITGAEDKEQAYQLFMHSKMMLKDGGFILRKFTSNSLSLQTLTHLLVLTLESEETSFSKRLSEAKLKWDEPVPDNLLGRWHSLKSSLEEGQSILIPQRYSDGVPDDLVSSTLCGFCDASLNAYVGIIYLVMETTTTILVKFIAAKTRVSPLKVKRCHGG